MLPSRVSGGKFDRINTRKSWKLECMYNGVDIGDRNLRECE